MSIRNTRAAQAHAAGQRPQDIKQVTPPPPFIVTLPLPPSLNNAYPGKGRRYASPELVAFKREAIPVSRVAAASAGFVVPPGATLGLTLRLWFGSRSAFITSDASNRIKAAEDALASALGFNDRTILDVRAIKCGVDVSNPRCEAELVLLEGMCSSTLP